MKVKFNFNLSAWISEVEIEGASVEDAKKKLFKMSIEELLEAGYVEDYDTTDIDSEVIEESDLTGASDDDDDDENEDNNQTLKHNIAIYMIKVGLHYASIENHNWTVDSDDIMEKFDLSHDTITKLLKQIATEGIIEEVGCECVADIEYSDCDCDGININFYMDYIPREYIDIDKIEINHIYRAENEENEENEEEK